MSFNTEAQRLRGTERRRVKLNEVFDLQMGKTPARANPLYWGGSNKWISIADIGKADVYISETKETISDEAIRETGISSIPKNTLIMSFKLSIGKVAITSEEMFSNEAIMSFRDLGKYELDLHYLYHQFKNKDWSVGINKAVMGLTLNKASLRCHEIFLPSLSEQRRIAGVLDRISEMKRNVEARIKKLDLLVKARFSEMFGDVSGESGVRGQELGSRGERRARGDGGRFVLKPISEMGRISTGSTPSMKNAEYYENADRCFFKPSDISDDVTMLSQSEFWVDNRSLSVSRPFNPGAVLVTCIGSIGKIGVAGVAGICNQQINFVEPYDNYLSIFIAYAILARKAILVDMANAPVVPIINKTQFSKFEIIDAPLSLQREFAGFVEKVESLKAIAKKELEKVDLLYRAKLQEFFG